MFNLFLDDERQPADVTWILLPEVDWVIVRNFDAFVEVVLERGLPEIVSFDHDLGLEHYEALVTEKRKHVTGYDEFKEKTGYHCAKWLVDHCLREGHRVPRRVFVHTMNPIGRQKIRDVFELGWRHDGGGDGSLP